MADDRREAEELDRELTRTTIAWRVGALEANVEKVGETLARHERELAQLPQSYVPRIEHERDRATRGDHTSRNVLLFVSVVNVGAVVAGLLLGHH